MQWKASKLAGTAAIALMVSGCGGGKGDKTRPEPIRPPSGLPMPGQANYGQDGPVRLGEPYDIDGKRYEPRDDAMHDEVGYAMVSGGFQGASASLIALVHRTLPIPSYVEVTNLETGKTILARVIERGPFRNDRVADLTPAAAQLLGLASDGTPVRIRRVNPPEAEKGALRSGRSAPTRLDTPPALLSALRRKLQENGAPVAAPAPTQTNEAEAAAPPPVVHRPARPAVKPRKPGADFSTPTAPVAAAPVTEEAAAPSGNGWFVQLGSFSDRQRADALAKRADARVYASGNRYRVRIGPFGSREEAEGPLGQVKSKGYPQATISR
ncbi:MAG TPA: SPOR domain-containing protein [Chakrabartia sp.]|jgi:rare lipoprotein A|nr:SPOR domain-containing protein [Chakrabartia sp.]